MFTLAYSNLLAMLLVFVRMGTMLLTNPILSRRQVPVTLRLAFVLIVSILIYPTLDHSAIDETKDLLYVLMVMKEFLVGLFFSMIFSLFYYMIFFAGDIMDVLFGLSMAKTFDPTTNIQVSISGQYLNIFFVLYFFVTNSHLAMIEIFANSYTLVPIGASFDIDIAGFLLSTFTATIELILRLIMPFLVATLVIEVLLGVLMKLVPQMHLMVINIQLKIIVGIFLLIALAYPVSLFIDNYIVVALDTMHNGMVQLSQ